MRANGLPPSPQLSMKPLLRHYPSLSVTAGSYIVASVEMALVSLYHVHDPSAWHVSGEAWLSLVYWIVVASMLAYFCMVRHCIRAAMTCHAAPRCACGQRSAGYAACRRLRMPL